MDRTPDAPGRSKGDRFTVLVATPAGGRARRQPAVGDRGSGQRVFSGAVKPADMRHDIAVYRAACEAYARIEAGRAGAHRAVYQRIDAELKGQVAGQAVSERARRAAGWRRRRSGDAPRRSLTSRWRAARCSFRTRRLST